MTTNPTGAPTRTSARTNGLDTLRALAIILVFVYHYRLFVGAEPGLGWPSVVGWVGVDLFFVLSGYLIANQLLAGLAHGDRLSLRAFYARRGLRTWPTFWVVLAAYFLFPAFMGGKTPPPLWTFLSFTQNFGLQPGTAFSHAWSLCIEEQFYLVLPLVVLAALRFGSRPAQAWLLLGTLLAVGVVSRFVMWAQFGREDFGQIEGFYPNVYYATLCRFDEFLPGVAVALLKNLHPRIWQRLARHGQALWWAGLAATALVLRGVFRDYDIDGYGYGGFMSVFGYSLVAMAFAVLVMAALTPTSWLHSVRIPSARALARLVVFDLPVAQGRVLRRRRSRTSQAWSPTVTLGAATTASVLVGVALYRLVERPCLTLRASRFPSNFVAAQQPTGTAARTHRSST